MECPLERHRAYLMECPLERHRVDLIECPLERHRAEAHARGGAQCRQECRERGYYHLHRQLNHSLFLHSSSFFSTIRVSSPPPTGGVRGGHSFPGLVT